MVGSLVVLVIVTVIVAVALTARAAAAGGERPAAAPAVVHIPVLPTPSAGVHLVTLPWGSGPSAVGLARPLEGLARGPEALAVAPDGRIAILDSVNRRVVTLDPSGAFLAALPVDLSAPRFIAVDDTSIHVLDADEDRCIVSLDWQGGALEHEDLEARDAPVTGLFAQEGQVYVEWGHSSVTGVRPGARGFSATEPGRPLGSRGRTRAQTLFTAGTNPRVSLVTDPQRPNDLPSEIEFVSDSPLEHLVSLDSDAEGAIILGARVQHGSPPDAGAPALVVVRATGPETATALALDDTGGIAETGQPYALGPDGRIYQPRATDQGYSIIVHTFPEGATR